MTHDPPRLSRSRAPAAEWLRSYAKRTTPGDRDGVAAWYRLRARLEATGDGAPGSAPGRGRRVWSLTRALTVALGVFVLIELVPPAYARVAGAMGAGGSEGAGGIEGAGGMHGSGRVDRAAPGA